MDGESLGEISTLLGAKMKVMIIVGTRPEIIRLSRIINLLRDTLDCIFVHTGQNFSFELGEIFYSDLGIKPPDYYLNAVGKTLAETLGSIIIKTDEILEKEKPDALLVLGDTNSALSVIPAKRRKIPIFHYEAGNRCFDQRVPEEINRKIVDHTSDINLAYSEIAKQNLLREGFPIDQVFNIGSPMFEILHHYEEKIDNSTILQSLNLAPYKYFVLSAHREENVDDPVRLSKLVDMLHTILEEYEYPIVFSIHPRTEARLLSAGITINPRIIKSKPLSFTDYISLQQQSFCVLSDSGTITEEAAILNFPAINIRETHERQEGMEQAAVVMTGFDSEIVHQAIKVAQRQRVNQELINPVYDYVQANTSEKVLRIILSYTNYINRKIWKK